MTTATLPGASEQRAAARVALGRALLADGAPLRFVVRGASMWPALRRGDVVEVEAASVASLRVGDVAVFRQGAVLLAHRVIEVLNPPGGPGRLRLRGDTRRAAEGPLGERELLGRIRQCERRGRARRLDRGLSRAWGQAMLHVGGLWAWCFDGYRAWRRTHARGARFITSALVLAGSLVPGAVTHAASFTLPEKIVLPGHPGPLSEIEVLAVLNRLKDEVVDPLRRAAAHLAHRNVEMTADRLVPLSKADRPTRPRHFFPMFSGGLVLLLGSDTSPDPHAIPGPAFAILNGKFAGYVRVALLRTEKGRQRPNEISVTFAPDTPRPNAKRFWAPWPGNIVFEEFLAPPKQHVRDMGRAANGAILRTYTPFRGVVEH